MPETSIYLYLTSHLGVYPHKMKKRLGGLFLAISFLLPISPVLPVANAADVQSTYVVQDSFYKARWNFTITHPNSVDCDWGKSDPRYSNGVLCNFSVTFTWNWTADPTAGTYNYAPTASDSPWNKANFELIDSTGKNLVSVYDSFYSPGAVNLIGYERKSSGTLTQKVTFQYSDPGPLKFLYKKSAILNTEKEVVLVSSPQTIQVNGKSKSAALAEIQAAEAKAKADADAKAKADAEAAAIARQKETARIQALKYTINCVKGKTSKKVMGDPPVCPSGFTDANAKLLPHVGYVKCRLYKKDSKYLGSVALQDKGRTLNFSTLGKYEGYGQNIPTWNDFVCATNAMGMPSFVMNQINTTRALDGRVTANWGKITATWTYHPDNGLNISFYNK